MRIQPRQHLLQIWQSLSQASMSDGEWDWGGWLGGDAISDAQQLLCLLSPSVEMPAFRLSSPDMVSDDVLNMLRPLGGALTIPQLLVRLVSDYLRRYAADDGTPMFTGSGQLHTADEDGPSAAQRDVDLTESYAISVTLTLAVLDFSRDFRANVRRRDLLSELDVLTELASDRLTAALVGLLRSFTVNVFEPDSPYGVTLCRMLNQRGEPIRPFVDGLRRALGQTGAGLRDLTFLSEGLNSFDDRPNSLFECGWTWGVCRDAPRVEAHGALRQPEGHASPEPYLYFTAMALDAIADLFSERTRLLGLLNEDQQVLARALQLRWDLTQSYWSTIARYGGGRWPLEDLPWRTTDGDESDQYSLMVASVVTHDLSRRRTADVDVRRVGQVLDDLARRARITQRATGQDPAIALHSPGLSIQLLGAEELGGPELFWTATDFAPRLLVQCIRLAGLIGDPGLRSEMMQLVDRIWDHLIERRIVSGPAGGLWDQPAQVFPQLEVQFTEPSWGHTYRVIQCLVAAAQVITGSPATSPRLAEVATDLLSAAEYVFDREFLAGGTDGPTSARSLLEQSRITLRRARELLAYHPGTTAALAAEVLRDLDRWAAAREAPDGRF